MTRKEEVQKQKQQAFSDVVKKYIHEIRDDFVSQKNYKMEMAKTRLEDRIMSTHGQNGKSAGTDREKSKQGKRVTANSKQSNSLIVAITIFAAATAYSSIATIFSETDIYMVRWAVGVFEDGYRLNDNRANNE